MSDGSPGETSRGQIGCAGCGARHDVFLDARYPEAGGTFACPSCRAPIVFPPRAEFLRQVAPPPVAAPPAEPPPVVYCVNGPAGDVEELGRFDVRDRIRAFAIDEETPLCLKGADGWRRAGDFPEFARYFALARESGRRPERAAAGLPAGPTPAESCRNHPGTRPTLACTTCGGLLCEACAVPPPPGSRMPPLCPVDRSICRPIVYEGPLESLSERAGSALKYPFGGGLAYLFFYSVLRALGSLWGYFPPTTFALLIFLFLAWIYDLEIVRVSAHGERELPRFPEGTDLPTWIGRGIKVFLVTILCWAPFLAYGFWAVTQVAEKVVASATEELVPPKPSEPSSFTLPSTNTPPDPQQFMRELRKMQEKAERERKNQEEAARTPERPSPALTGLAQKILAWSAPFFFGLVLVGLLCYAWFWMALAYAAVWDTVLPALNPARILRGMAACGGDYVLFLLLAVGSTAVLLVVKVILFRVPFVGGFLAIPFEAAVSFWLLHLLGWMVFRHQVDLGWD